MMRGISITLLPMLAAAALALWGGERLARREVETRMPADRVRLLDFSTALQDELTRLDRVYVGHLEALAKSAPILPAATLTEECRDLAAVRECHLFPDKGQPVRIEGGSTHSSEKLPEVLLEDGKKPFNPNEAVILSKTLGRLEGGERSGWITAPDHIHRIFWQRPRPDQLVVLVIDSTDLHDRTHRHLVDWMKSPFAPLHESG